MVSSSLAALSRQETVRPRAVKRGDIQGLRALAVMLVAVCHFFPTTIPGGFVGVDVFFVISGFLITGGLLGEVERSGSLSLVGFYARRIRRLMPAAVVVTVATLVVSAVAVGPVRLAHILTDAAWTSAYLANYHLAQAPDGYFGASDRSPFRHFWSLAVEEQFYLLWPLLILVVVTLAKRRWAPVLGGVLAVVIAGSLVASVVLTNDGSNHAYYSLGTRAWELGIGAALALLVARVPRRSYGAAVSVAPVVGLAAVLGAAVLYTDTTPFPGWTAAVPTVGTALIIWAGCYEQGPVGRLLSIPPAQFLGNISYSLYLWHWPVLVLATEIVARPLTRVDRLALLALSILLGAASYVFIEQTTARARRSWSARRVVATGLVVALVGVLVPAVAASHVVRTDGPAAARDDDRAVEASVEDGAVVVHPRGPGRTPAAVPSNVTPSLESLTGDLAEVFTNGCFSTTLVVCDGGDPDGDKTVVLAGDSHVGQWWPAADKAAAENGWKLYIVGMSGCPLADVEISEGTTDAAWPECSAWQRDAVAATLDLDPDLVVYANNSQGYRAKPSLATDYDRTWPEGVGTVLKQLTAAGPVLYVGQFPRLAADPATCLSEHVDDVDACATAVDAAVPAQARAMDVELARRYGALYFDPTQLLCRETCPMIDQDMVMYRDVGHLSRTYSTYQAPRFAEVVRAALAAH